MRSGPSRPPRRVQWSRSGSGRTTPAPVGPPGRARAASVRTAGPHGPMRARPGRLSRVRRRTAGDRRRLRERRNPALGDRRRLSFGDGDLRQRHLARVAPAEARSSRDPHLPDRRRHWRPVQTARVRRGDDRRSLFLLRPDDRRRHEPPALVERFALLQRSMPPRPEVDGLNAGYAALVLEQYLDNPASVSDEWRAVFESSELDELVAMQPGLARLLERFEPKGGNGHALATPPPPAAPAPAAPAPPVVDDELLGGVAAATTLVKAFRMHGHLAARLDPLGSEPPGDPALEPERLIPELTPELQARIPASLLSLYVKGETLADALPRLREVYCGTIAYEIEHISDHEERIWLRQAIESGRYRQPLTDDERVRLLARLSQVEGMEQYLRRAFLGQKQFSIEGLDVMVPMLDESIELAADGGAHEVVIGMAHRGRLKVLAHVVGRPYEVILREFEGERTIEAVVASDEGGTGDVKYHLGADGTRATRAGEITVTLASNPSHLEAVDPVVEGRARAEQTDRSTPEGYHDPSIALPVLIHGDASFAGQGEVAETLNLQGLAGSSTGGTLHVIGNNQVGFTTDPSDGRSTRYSSDLAKGFDVPIIHVNADDPEAAISVIRLAQAYRHRFGHDVVVDLVGYRRLGHNEQDEAAYTQPLLAAAIAAHPTC